MLLTRLAIVLLWSGLVIAPSNAQQKNQFVRGWGDVTNPARDCTFAGTIERLAISVPGTATPHDLNPLQQYSNVLGPRVMQEVDGDFQVQVKVLPFPLPAPKTSTGKNVKVSYVGAGLLVWIDDKTFVRYLRAVSGENGNVAIHLEAFQDAKFYQVELPPNNSRKVKQDQATYLRVDRRENKLTFSTSVDGQSWVTIGDIDKLQPPRKVRTGVGVVNATSRDFAPEFEDLRLAASSSVPNASTPTGSASSPTASPSSPTTSISDHQPSIATFTSDEPSFPFVMQVEKRGELNMVRGMGRMPVSGDDPTMILAEIAGISLADNPQAIRGVLTMQPDGDRLKEPQLSPWVGLYDPDAEIWQMMLSPKHVVEARRSGRTAKHNGKLGSAAQTGTVAIDPSQNDLFTVADIAAHSSAAFAADRPQTNTEPVGTTAHDGLPALYDQAIVGLKGLGTTMAQRTEATKSGSGGPANPTGLYADADAIAGFMDHLRLMQLVPPRNADSATSTLIDYLMLATDPPLSSSATGGATSPPRATPTRTTPVAPSTSISSSTPKPPTGTTPAAPGSRSSPSNTALVALPNPANATAVAVSTMPLDDALAFLWAVGMSPDRISYTLVPARRPEDAWQVVRINRLPDGRIEIVNYGNAPDGPAVAQGVGSSNTVGSSTTAPTTSAGHSASNGSNTSTTNAGGANLDGANSSTTANNTNNTTTPSTNTTPGARGSGGSTSGTGGPANDGSTTRVVNVDGSNLVVAHPPNLPPIDSNNPPPAPPTTNFPPMPPAEPPLNPIPPRTMAGGPGTGRGDGVYDPNITVLVNEDSGQAPTPALSAAQINAARAALNRNMAAAGIQALTKGPKEGKDHNHDTSKSSSEPRGFQPGDAALIGAGFSEGSMTPGGSLALNGHKDRDHEGLWFNIFTTTLPNDVENAVKHHQEYWEPPKPQDDDDATVTLHRYEMSDTEGILHFVRDVHVNAEATSCAYHHFVVYRGFLIQFGHNVSGRVVHDVGRDWPNVLRNAQQLIDRRFPKTHPADGSDPDKKHRDQKPHALDGVWESSTPNGLTLEFGLTIQGNTIRLAMNPNGESRFAGIPTIEGTISGDGNALSGSLSTPGPKGEPSVPFTMTLSPDGKSMTVSTGGVDQTWIRK